MLDELKYYVPIVADWASIIALFVSVYAAYAITKVRSEVVARVRLPALLGALEVHGKNFATLMRTFDEGETKDQFALELARCEANLRLVRKKLKREAASRASKLLRKIRRYKGPSWFGIYAAANTRDDAWNIYAELNGLVEEVKNFVEEQKMGV